LASRNEREQLADSFVMLVPSILRRIAWIATAVWLAGCHRNVLPPPSRPPSALAAITRARSCGVAARVEAKFDQWGERGRLRGDLLFFVESPDHVRFDATVLGSVVSTMTSDGSSFALWDVKANRFLTGAPSACTMAQLISVPLPPGVLVSLLLGQAVVPPSARAASLRWSGEGYYVATFDTAYGTETIALAPRPQDFAKPREEHRMRLVSIAMANGTSVLYSADFDDYDAGEVAVALHDPDGIDADVMPSGPACDADVPHKVHIAMPGSKADIRVRYSRFVWNPPLPAESFRQPAPAGIKPESVQCR
jgi:hypothetical protein